MPPEFIEIIRETNNYIVVKRLSINRKQVGPNIYLTAIPYEECRVATVEEINTDYSSVPYKGIRLSSPGDEIITPTDKYIENVEVKINKKYFNMYEKYSGDSILWHNGYSGKY